MTVFIDTSAFYAVFDRDDSNHSEAKNVWTRLIHEAATFLTSNYVLVETAALLQHRLGMAAVRVFQEEVVPLTGFRKNGIGVRWKPYLRQEGRS